MQTATVPRNNFHTRELNTDLLISMGFPRKFLNLEKKDFLNSASFQVMCDYLKDIHRVFEEGRSLFIYGEGNTGKTAKAVQIAKIFWLCGYSARFTSAYDLHEALSGRSWDKEDEVSWREKYLKVDVLVVDDLSVELNSFGRSGFVPQMIKDRYHNEMPTIVTCPVKEIGELIVRNVYPDHFLTKLTDFVPMLCTDSY